MNKNVRWGTFLLVMGSMASPGCHLQEEDATAEQQLKLKGSSLGMVVDNATGSATVFNADTNTILGTVPGAVGSSGDCSITTDGTKGFFTHFNSSVTVADLTTPTPSLASGPNPIQIANPGEDTALSPDGKFLLVCDGSTPVPVSVIDVATQTQISTFNTGSDCNSVDVCSDGSVLVTSFNTSRVRRLRLSGSGVLTDTGESLTASSPVNVYCSPTATAGIVVNTFAGTATSFKLPGLAAVSTRNIGSSGISGAINHAGDRAYFRSSGGVVTGFSFDQTTGVLGAAPFFQVTAASAITFFGMDQLAVHPSDASLYISEPGRLRILDAQTGATTGAITGGSMSQATGVCFGAIEPNQPPVAKCADRTVPADGTCHAVASIDDGSFDPDKGDTFQCTQVPSGPFDEGTTKVTLTCTDSHGASSSCSANVTVADQTAPDLACPADQTVECSDGHGGATATFTATATDNCDGETAVTCVPASGSTFPLGTTADVCSTSDASGNVSRCSHNVTVVDTAPATVITSTPASLWPPNHKYHQIDLADCIVSIQDACDGPLDIASHATIASCTSSEPDNGLGDGDTANDCVIVDSHSVNVRAERSGNGDGRVYTIHYTVTDASNNASDQTCLVTVPHSQNGSAAVDGGL